MSVAVGATTLALIGLSVVSAPPAAAVESVLYVAAGGANSSNTCVAAASPCATITHALTQLPKTDPVTIMVSGTIVDRFTVPAREITISGAGAASPAVIDGGSGGSVVTNAAGAALHLKYLTIQRGAATANGGGIWFLNGTSLSLSHVTVYNNTAFYSGGGIGVVGGTMNIANSTISGNTTGLCGGCGPTMRGGGGIWVGPSASVSIVNSTISGNTSQGSGNGSGGGVSANGADSVTIYGSTISGNTATYRGGGIENVGTLNVMNSTITGNTAVATGGGIAGGSSSNTIVTATTIANNSSELFDGGGVYIEFGTLTAGATIISSNSGGNCDTQEPLGTITSAGYNLDTDGSCDFASTGDLHDVAADIGALANNGGPTLTMLPASTGQPVGKIPSGTTLNGVSACSRTDQRGAAGPAPGQTRCTIGATEVGAGVAPSFTSSASTTVTRGVPFTFPVTTTSNIPPALSVSPSTPLPAEVTFTDDGGGKGTLAGVPSTGVYTFTLQAANGVLQNASQSFTLTVTEPLCHGLPATHVGTADPESIKGTSGDDVIVGLGGNDVITGDLGNDTICGGNGDDTMVGSEGADWLEGGAGTDLVSYSNRTEVLRITLDMGTGDDGSSLDGGPGERDNIVQVEKAIGGSGNDLLIGNSGANTLTSLGGNDTLLGGVGNDSLSGGPGDDTLNGSTGADRFDGGTGTDTASYTDRNSTTIVTIDNIANDGYTADGPATARDNVLGSVENLTGGGGNDTLKGSSIANRLIGMKGADRFYGNGGNDTLLAKDGIKDVTIDGGTGTDAVGRDSIDPTPVNVP